MLVSLIECLRGGEDKCFSSDGLHASKSFKAAFIRHDKMYYEIVLWSGSSGGSKANINFQDAPQKHSVLVCPKEEELSSLGHSKIEVFIAKTSAVLMCYNYFVKQNNIK